MHKVKILCSRCERIIEGFEEEGIATSGFYRLEGFWEQFKRSPEESFLCDACMQADPKYRALYPHVAE